MSEQRPREALLPARSLDDRVGSRALDPLCDREPPSPREAAANHSLNARVGNGHGESAIQSSREVESC
jgi:hypothetical protein